MGVRYNVDICFEPDNPPFSRLSFEVEILQPFWADGPRMTTGWVFCAADRQHPWTVSATEKQKFRTDADHKPLESGVVRIVANKTGGINSSRSHLAKNLYAEQAARCYLKLLRCVLFAEVKRCRGV